MLILKDILPYISIKNTITEIKVCWVAISRSNAGTGI